MGSGWRVRPFPWSFPFSTSARQGSPAKSPSAEGNRQDHRLLAAKQQEFDGYEEYIAAVTGYWTARVDLQRAVGGRLPGPAESQPPRTPADGGRGGEPQQEEHIPHMRGPDNTLPMMAGAGPFGNIEMGGMFTVVKVRDDLKSYDEDPGWHRHPEGTVAWPVK